MIATPLDMNAVGCVVDKSNLSLIGMSLIVGLYDFLEVIRELYSITDLHDRLPCSKYCVL